MDVPDHGKVSRCKLKILAGLLLIDTLLSCQIGPKVNVTNMYIVHSTALPSIKLVQRTDYQNLKLCNTAGSEIVSKKSEKRHFLKI